MPENPFVLPIGLTIICWNSSCGPPATTLYCPDPVVDLDLVTEAHIEHNYQLQNGSALPIRITGIEKSCSCLDPTLSNAIIGPGQQATVTLIAEIKPQPAWKRTRFVHSMNVYHDASPGLPVSLIIRGTFLPPICLAEDSLTWEIEESRHRQLSEDIALFIDCKQEVAIVSAEVPDAHWLTVSVNDPQSPDGAGFQRVLVNVSGQYRADSVTLPVHSTLRIATSHPGMARLDVPLAIVPHGSTAIELQPDRISCGVLAAGETCHAEIVARWRTATGFQIKAIEARNWIKYTSSLTDQDEHTILRLLFEIAPLPGAISIQENIRLVVSNGDLTRTVDVPLSGVVRE